MQNKIKTLCECGTKILSWKSQKRKFCSNKCRLKSLHKTTPNKKKTGNNGNCKYCDKEIYIPLWKLKGGKGKYCSKKCYGKHKSELFKGEKNPQYIDGRTKKYTKSFYLSAEWRICRKEVYKRDKYQCQDCGKKGGRLIAHHEIPVGICEDPLDKNNIRTVCYKCHKKTQRR